MQESSILPTPFVRRCLTCLINSQRQAEVPNPPTRLLPSNARALAPEWPPSHIWCGSAFMGRHVLLQLSEIAMIAETSYNELHIWTRHTLQVFCMRAASNERISCILRDMVLDANGQLYIAF